MDVDGSAPVAEQAVDAVVEGGSLDVARLCSLWLFEGKEEMAGTHDDVIVYGIAHGVDVMRRPVAWHCEEDALLLPSMGVVGAYALYEW